MHMFLFIMSVGVVSTLTSQTVREAEPEVVAPTDDRETNLPTPLQSLKTKFLCFLRTRTVFPNHLQSALSLAPLPLPTRISRLETMLSESEARVRLRDTMRIGRPRSTDSHGLSSLGFVDAHWKPKSR